MKPEQAVTLDDLRGYRIGRGLEETPSGAAPWYRLIEVTLDTDGGVRTMGRSVLEAPTLEALAGEMLAAMRALQEPFVALPRRPPPSAT